MIIIETPKIFLETSLFTSNPIKEIINSNRNSITIIDRNKKIDALHCKIVYLSKDDFPFLSLQFLSNLI